MRKTTKLINYIQKNVNKWKDFPCSRIGKLNIFKISPLTNLIYRSIDTIKSQSNMKQISL